ncbi:MAG: 16S rRNA (adenine(1518)-N(6)/adenine(1519)-N(6))-dimethyltransferase RsmA [Proteobacteria bacterium]|jgi:16S rRNA (adenine1518-N6/adenine1519-N6)-dimethyltransferase|nr:16S rRNA (adenine(1518)-N(6)/adenine(1519)-N(6))-dimethyltransferase RsmA [Pseudomonadota bacterium]
MTAKQYLDSVLTELQIEAKKSLGQNFLVSDHVIDKIIQRAKGFNAKNLIEIGPGPGALTRFLKDFPVEFQVVELDRVLAEYWRNKGLQVLEVDALQADWSTLIPNTQTLLVSNLPYQISSSLVIERCLDPHRLMGMVLMFQKEVAQRIKAIPDQDGYGMLSVIAQTYWKVDFLLEASSHDFSPPPKVASRVLVFQRLESDLPDPRLFLKWVKAAFLHPRKLLASNMAAGQAKVSKAKVSEWLVSRGFSEKARPGELSVKDYIDFFRSFQ